MIDLIEAYRPEAQALCGRVASALKDSSEELMASRSKLSCLRHTLL